MRTKGPKRLGCPCIACDLSGCQAGPKIIKEFETVVEHATADVPGHRWYHLNRLIEASLKSLAALYVSGARGGTHPEVALPAIFDLCVNALYAEYVTDGGWLYCLGPTGAEAPVQYYSFVGACPRCSMKGRYFPATAHKPESANIGSASSATLGLLLGKVLRFNSKEHGIVSSASVRGDIDLFVYGKDILALGEIKASPLITYPLAVSLDAPLTTESTEGAVQRRPNHERESPRVVREAQTIFLYVPQIDLRIDLGSRDTDGWPFAGLIRFLEIPNNLGKLLAAWELTYQAYAEEKRSPVLYLTHGCGKTNGVSISDSKNAPGLDRTDDIKKGTYQMLKYGAYLSEKCKRRLIRVFLAGNTHAVTHSADYLEELEDIVWTKERFSKSSTSATVTWPREKLLNLFDGLICLTRVVARDPILGRLFSLDSFARELPRFYRS